MGRRQVREGPRTSSEKSTPPIGLPKATATPVADAAVTISRILATVQTKREEYPGQPQDPLDRTVRYRSKEATDGSEVERERQRTLTSLEPAKAARYNMANRARDMDGRTFLADRETGGDGDRLCRRTAQIIRS